MVGIQRCDNGAPTHRGGEFIFGIYTIAFWSIVAFVSLGMLESAAVSRLFVLYSYAAIVYFMGFSAIRVFIVERRVFAFGMTGFHAIALILGLASAISVLLEGLTLCGAPGSSPFVLGDWGIKRMAVFFVVSLFVIFVFSLYAKQIKMSLVTWRGVASPCFRKWAYSLIASLVLALVVAFGAAHWLRLELIPVALLFVAVAFGLTVIFLTSMPIHHVEWCFLAVALPFGMVMCTQIPAMTGISWDDQIHYRNALKLSYLTSPEYTDAEVDMWDMAVLRAEGEEKGVGLQRWSGDEVASYYSRIDSDYVDDVAAGRVASEYYPEQLFSFTSVGYIPSALGLWIGRAAHLPFSIMVILGRLANLFSYCVVCFYAIRIAPAKKTLFAVIALIPTNLFLASSYAYDPWVSSFLMLGVALLLREMWGKEGHINPGRLIVTGFVFFLALCVKAIYFPVIGLFFLMPREKFANESQRFKYYGCVVLFGLYVLASFAVPFLFGVGSGTATGDSRGGSEVSASGQLGFILSNPLEYVGILKRFLLNEYFNPALSSRYMFATAYVSDQFIAPMLGAPAVNYLSVIYLAGVAILDNDEGGSWRRASVGAAIWSFVIYVCTFILVATALYVDFTPVGYSTVNGCQARYQLPMLAPTLAIMLNMGKRLGTGVKMRRLVMALSLVGLSFIVFFSVVIKYSL